MLSKSDNIISKWILININYVYSITNKLKSFKIKINIEDTEDKSKKNLNFTP